MMRSEKSCVVVPNWNLSNQRQEQVEVEERNRSSSHVHTHHNPIQLVSMSDYEVAELTWENGQLAMHGLSGLVPTGPTKPTWTRANDTLESIVHQATWHTQNPDPTQVQDLNPTYLGTKWVASSGPTQNGPGLEKKRVRPEFEQCVRDYGSSVQEDHGGGGGNRSVCASASAATFCRDNDTTLMTWTSFESPSSLKTKTLDDDSASLGGSENRDEEQEIKGTMIRSHSTRRSRTAAIHNQSERRRRDRINQKMKALQKLVPNSSKTDKASMLDEVIEYLKQLQAQVQMMSLRNMPQMMMQHHLQMSLLARMGMGMGVGLGMGMGVLDMSTMARTAPPPMPHPSTVAATTPTFLPPPFAVPQMIRNPHAPPQGNPSSVATNASVPLSDPYCAFLAQSMNIDLYNKMAALYQHQVNQTAQSTGNSSQLNHIQRK